MVGTALSRRFIDLHFSCSFLPCPEHARYEFERLMIKVCKKFPQIAVAPGVVEGVLLCGATVFFTGGRRCQSALRSTQALPHPEHPRRRC